MNYFDPGGIFARCLEGTTTSGDGRSCRGIDSLESVYTRYDYGGTAPGAGGGWDRGGGGPGQPSNRVSVDGVEFTDLALLSQGSRTYDMVNTLFAGLTEVMDPDCQNWLTSGTVNNLGNLFSSAMTVMGSATSIVDTRHPGGVVNAITGVGANQVGIALNQQGAFFSGSVSTNDGRISGNTDRARVFILIHELAHFNGVPGFRSDRGNADAGTANNNMIQEHCPRTLRRYNGSDQSWRP